MAGGPNRKLGFLLSHDPTSLLPVIGPEEVPATTSAVSPMVEKWTLGQELQTKEGGPARLSLGVD